ncbi:DUF397 domain-containing protein [Streptomyces sp. NRRL S-337]|uniref:DUF397 domain-containing protein n=1 Tax=Streptomyces sp. NRRL S-337 TaxID=1463900 RepID=UPI0004C62BE4|nr:DUF397 domain-containing protein [Streptomyces sp. NRRL S-337]
MNTELAWFKSSYSGGTGEACIEVAVAWRKSSYSGNEDEACVEVAAGPDTIHIRDSKDVSLPSIAVTPAAWASFLAYAQVAPEAV